MYNTDKYYWHRYIPEYERIVFSTLPETAKILEIGVLGGESVRLLSDRFPKGQIVGADIQKPSSTWPVRENITYKEVDQSKKDSVLDLLMSCGYVDLIIDDGSHIPEHQAMTFKDGLCYINKGGWYIIEDVHSSFWDLKASPLVLLLALKHLREIGINKLSEYYWQRLESKFFSQSDIIFIDRMVQEIHTYRRSCLPLKCFRCGKSDFDYANLKCTNCRESLYLPYDSMSLMLRI